MKDIKIPSSLSDSIFRLVEGEKIELKGVLDRLIGNYGNARKNSGEQYVFRFNTLDSSEVFEGEEFLINDELFTVEDVVVDNFGLCKIIFEREPC